MKKIVGFLFTLQLLMIIIYGLNYLRNLDFYQAFLEDRSIVLLNFDEELASYDLLLEVFEEHGIDVSQLFRPNSEKIVVYSTDVTLNGRISLIEGTFPSIGTSEFISTLETGKAYQVGLIREMISDTKIEIRSFANIQSGVLSGIYYIHTTDALVLREIIDALHPVLLGFHIADDLPPFHILRVLASIHFQETTMTAASTFLQMREFIFFFPVITLCLIISLFQYVSVRMKRATIFMFHGYDKKKILKEMTLDLTQGLLLGGLVAFIFSIILVLLTNQQRILLHLIVYSLIFIFLVIAIYLLIAIGLMISMLGITNVLSILKGRKMKLRIQGFNHLIKCVFVGLCLFQFVDVIHGLSEFQMRVVALQYWEQAQNVYQIIVDISNLSEIGTKDSEKIEFYNDLVRYHDVFLIDTNRIFGLELDQQFNDNWWVEEELTHWDNVLYINPNFLRFNPIYDFNHHPVYEQLQLEPRVLNIILPDRFIDEKETMTVDYLEMFQMWMRDYLIDHQLVGEDVLSLNFIHVPDGQYYFSLNPFLRLETGHRVRDPIAIIYYEQFTDFIFIPSALTHSVYFLSDSDDPFLEIQELVYTHGLEAQITQVEAVYDQHMAWVGAIREHYLRLIALILLLIISNIAVTYNLVANYFERYKFEIFLKSTLGYHVFRRNRLFLLTYFSYSIPLMALMIFFQGRYILLVGVATLALDVIMIMVFERRLFKKSFAEIMKGER